MLTEEFTVYLGIFVLAKADRTLFVTSCLFVFLALQPIVVVFFTAW
jgi:hypothetical protein